VRIRINRHVRRGLVFAPVAVAGTVLIGALQAVRGDNASFIQPGHGFLELFQFRSWFQTTTLAIPHIDAPGAYGGFFPDRIQLLGFVRRPTFELVVQKEHVRSMSQPTLTRTCGWPLRAAHWSRCKDDPLPESALQSGLSLPDLAQPVPTILQRRAIPLIILPAGFAVNTCAWAAIIATISLVLGRVRAHRRDQAGECRHCRHRLHDDGLICPECGGDVSGRRMPAAG
jgi:hypothetical protein